MLGPTCTNKKTKRAYTKAGPYTTTIPISPYLAWAAFRSSNKILIDSTEAVQVVFLRDKLWQQPCEL